MRIIIISSYRKHPVYFLRNIDMAHVQKFVNDNQRMFKKTLSYYIMHITVAMLVGYFVTGSLAMAIALSLLEPTVQAVAFFFHEKAWEAKSEQSNNEEITA